MRRGRNRSGFAVEVDRDGLAVAHTREEGNFTRVDARVVLGVSEHGGHIRVLNATGDEVATMPAEAKGAGVIGTSGRGGQKPGAKPGG